MRIVVGIALLIAACGGTGSGDGGGGVPGADVVGVEDAAPGPECQTSQDCFDVVGPLGPCQAAVCVAGASTCAVEAISDGAGCDDGSACTQGDQCLSGECVPGPAPACDDGNPCTADSCDPGTGCVSGANSCPCEGDADCAAFEDDDLCNGTLICRLGEDGLTSCDVDPGTVVTCASDDSCVEAGECVAGLCVPGDAVDCDDGNPCTDDACEPVGGCTHVDNASCGPCVGVECLGCAFGVDCAAEGPYLEGTCCAEGDNLFYIDKALGAEVVDVDVDGVFSVTCGGFGAEIHDVSTPGDPKFMAGVLDRCQRIAFGPLTPDGARVVYIAHHGDSFKPDPFFSVHTLDVQDGVTTVGKWSEPGVIYEGMAWGGGFLFVAAHTAGVRVYTTDAQGLPTYLMTLGGFENAVKVALSGSHGYVADGLGGLKVFTFGGLLPPKVVQSLPADGRATDVVAHQGRVYLALGASGVDVFDATDPGALVPVDHIDTLGSVQAVAADGDLLALAAWSHVAVHSVSSLQRIGTEQVRSYPDFDQILGVQVSGNNIFVGEWDGLHILEYRPGVVGPDLWIENELLSFDGDVASAQAVILRNLGALDLEISDIQPGNDALYAVDKTAVTIPPGESAVVEVTYTPLDGINGHSEIQFLTNDPDAYQSPFELHLVAGSTSKLDIGDVLPASFGFLDPTGGGQVDNLDGKVVVLAYFALF